MNVRPFFESQFDRIARIPRKVARQPRNRNTPLSRCPRKSASTIALPDAIPHRIPRTRRLGSFRLSAFGHTIQGQIPFRLLIDRI